MAEFTWTPDFSSGKNTRPRARKIQFGDGYMQRVSLGLNPKIEVWTVSFRNRTVAEIDAIEAFLEALEGVDSFDWTPPRSEVEKRFVCIEEDGGWTRTLENAGMDSLTAIFRQVHEP